MATDDEELITAMLDIKPPEAAAGNRLKRLDTKYRAPEKLAKLQPRHVLMATYMVHGILSPTRCRQLRVGVDVPLTMLEAADAARVRRREARRIIVDQLFRQELARQLRAFREFLAPEATRTIAAIAFDPGDGTAADRKVQLQASTTLLGENSHGGGSTNLQVNLHGGDGQRLQAGIVCTPPKQRESYARRNRRRSSNPRTASRAFPHRAYSRE